MGLVQRCREEGRQLGWQEGRQEGRQEGTREGLLAGIELGLDLRFRNEGLGLLADIRGIDDIGVLRKIQAELRTADTPAARRRLYKNQ